MESGSARAARLRANAERLLDKADKLEETYLDEPVGDDATIWFRKQFNFQGPVYTYAAVRAAGKWYTTNSSNYKTGPWEWEALVDWIRQGYTYEIWRVSEFVPLENSESKYPQDEI